jgi:hypothetical protein
MFALEYWSQGSYRNGMKSLALLSALILPITIVAQSPSSTAIRTLSQSHPEINWKTTSAITADFDCDGKADTVVLGSKGKDVAVGVIWGAESKHPEVSTFPLRSATQDGFCSVPTRIEASPHDCDTGEGRLPGCVASKSCKDFSVVDDDCDSFNFYWDSKQKRLAWWRR